MDSTIQANLNALLPTLNSTLPQPLLDLAHSLYAQSRAKAATLKPAEEPARSWVCCEIAVERLKQRLNLPKPQSRPPCPPRVYKKLYAYLDDALKVSASTPKKAAAGKSDAATPVATPRKRTAVSSAKTTTLSRTPHTSYGEQSKPSPGTTSKRQKLEPSTSTITERNEGGPATSKSSVAAGKEARLTDEGLPDWSVPTIRHLCKTFGAPEAVPHVYVGVASVAKASMPPTFKTSGKAAPKDLPAIDPERIPALAIAVLFLVLERMTGHGVGTAGMRLAIQELIALRRITIRRAVEFVAEVERLIEDRKEAWSSMEWFKNVPGGDDVRMEDQQGDEPMELDEAQQLPHRRAEQEASRETAESDPEPLDEELEDEPSPDPPADGALHVGLGTMMQAGVDWLNPDRRAHFRDWKSRIMARISEIEQGNVVAAA